MGRERPIFTPPHHDDDDDEFRTHLEDENSSMRSPRDTTGAYMYVYIYICTPEEEQS